MSMTIAQHVSPFLASLLLAAIFVLCVIWRELPSYPWWPRILGALLILWSGYAGIVKLIDFSQVSLSHGNEGMDPFAAIFVFIISVAQAVGPAGISTLVLGVIAWGSPKDEC